MIVRMAVRILPVPGYFYHFRTQAGNWSIHYLPERHGTCFRSLSGAAVSRSVSLGGAAVVATIIGFVQTIGPLIELGVALCVIALIANPKPRPYTCPGLFDCSGHKSNVFLGIP
jgi:hypothetical protein